MKMVAGKQGAEITSIVIDVTKVSLRDLLKQDSALSRAAKRIVEQREHDDFEVCGFSNFI